MKILLFNKLILLCLFSIFLSPCHSMEKENFDEKPSQIMKFRLGFEFQEGSGLCPWALNDYSVQKKILFAFKEKGKFPQTENEVKSVSLWHVVIDTSDIEFVTKPFTDSLSLKTSITTLLKAFNSLQELLEYNKDVTFETWVNNIVSTDSLEIVLLENNFGLVRNKNIIKPSDEWKPKFSPQATIQHPLEYSIPLYFGLFGFNEPQSMLPFVASLPFRDLYLQCHEFANSENFEKLLSGYKKKISGLVFLHALTLVQMTPNEESSDAEFLKETLKMQTDFQQIDAKIRLTLMSRRPFSSMLAGILEFVPSKYFEFFNVSMKKNERFMKIFEVPALFYKANYAEQYFDEETGAEKSLLNFLPYFNDDFVNENKETLEKLLEKGIVSTAMLRNLKDEQDVSQFLPLFKDPKKYYDTIVKSIAFPKERYILDLESCCIKTVDCEFDDLSPPLFLNFQNSMGAYKNEQLDEEKEYGEAIIEVRGIRNVGRWFLEKAKLDSKVRSSFLTQAKKSTIEEALALFNFLSEFTSFDYTNDIILGMTHSVYKY